MSEPVQLQQTPLVPFPPAQESSLDGIVWPAFTGIKPLLGETVRLYFSNLPFIIFTVLIIFAPVDLLKNFLLYEAHQNENIMLSVRIDSVLSLIFDTLFTPVILYALFTRVKTQTPITLRQAFSFGMEKWGRVFRYTFSFNARIILGVILFVIPGFILAVRYALVAVVATLEDPRGLDVWDRSWKLTAKHGWKILALFVISGGSAFALTIVFGILSAFIDNTFTATIIDIFTNILFAFLTVLQLTIYLAIVHGTHQQTLQEIVLPPFLHTAPEAAVILPAAEDSEIVE